MTDPAVVRFLVRAAHEFAGGGWVFTGFNWPLLAGRLARRLYGEDFTQVFEAGAASNAPTRLLPTSTTDYPAYADSCCFTGSAMDSLFALVPRLDKVLLDAGNVDLRGCVNSTAIGSFAQPRVRLPGGGGAADVAARASSLVLLHAGADLRRLVERVDAVTVRPRPGAEVTLVTPAVVLALGERPSVLEMVGELQPNVRDRLAELGVPSDEATLAPGPSEEERREAEAVLAEAASRGAVAAKRALGMVDT